MKKFKSILFYSLTATIAVSSLTSCGKDDDDNKDGNPVDGSSNVIIAGGITSDETWTSDNVYQLSGRVVVEEGATLTIEPGTIIKAEGGREANASVLIIARGAKINANGTADEPIIFTSMIDEIEPGETVSPNLDETFSGLWGGVIVLGRAPISAANNEVQIEGIPPSDTRGLYGGQVADDNSGVLNYVSIRHGGTLIGEGNEINGLTLGGVGNGTTVSNIEVVSNLDDGIEWFGGTVNVENALVWAVGDDALDVDQAYSGTLTNFMVINGAETDHAFEVDGPEGTKSAGFTMINGTVFGYEGGGEYADFRDGSLGTLSNIYFTGFSEDSDVELDDNATSDNYKAGTLEFNNWEFNVSHLSAGNTTLDAIIVDKSDNGGAFADYSFAEIVTDNGSVGADASVFGWTFAKAKSGKL